MPWGWARTFAREDLYQVNRTGIVVAFSRYEWRLASRLFSDRLGQCFAGIRNQTGGYKNCPRPNSAKLAAKIYEIKDGATMTSPVLVRASGNSARGSESVAGVDRNGKKQYVKWGDQLAKRFTLSTASTASR